MGCEKWRPIGACESDPETHIDEELLERYAMGQLEEPDAAPVEGHLLVCGHCQDRLAFLDAYVQAMRGALRAG